MGNNPLEKDEIIQSLLTNAVKLACPCAGFSEKQAIALSLYGSLCAASRLSAVQPPWLADSQASPTPVQSEQLKDRSID